MRFLQNSLRQETAGRRVTAVFAVIAIAYPFVVYALHERVPFIVLALGASLLLLLRAGFAPSGLMATLRRPLIVVAAALAVLSFVDAPLAAKAYPPLVCLMIAALFANSLRRPPSLVERIARLRHPDLSPAGQEYCRRVTWVWVAWLLFNATVATILAASDHIALWALWTGLISHLCTGALFLGEMLMRPWLQGAARHRNRDA